MNTQIFVEGIADQKFIEDYVQYLDLRVKPTIIQTRGWTTISSSTEKGRNLKLQMNRNTAEGGINLIIFDTDLNFIKRQTEINQWKLDCQFELFLFPQNHESSTGALEDLLEQIINPKNQAIFECWEKYEHCLKQHNKGLTTPAKKSKIYCYLETLVGISRSEKDKIKDHQRNFLEPKHWNLESQALNPLKEFLETNLKND